MSTIVCGVDESAGGAEALQVARDLSHSLEARLVVAHVAPGYEAVEGGAGLGNIQARQGATRLVDRLTREHGLTDQADRRVEVGEPAEGLARIAVEEGATIIVVGSRRNGLRRRKLLSTLADDLAQTAPCPVVIVPVPQARR